MDEPDWGEENPGEPDWVFDPSHEPDPDGELAVVGEMPGIGEIRAQHHKAYDRWTPEAEAELVAAYLAGRSVEQLAAQFERQPSAIRRRLERAAFDEMERRRVVQPDSEPH